MNIDCEMLKQFGTEEKVNRAKMISSEMRRLVVDRERKTALDYGCGMGLVGLYLAGDFKTMLLVDSYAETMEEVEKNLSELNEHNISTACFDIMETVPEDIKADYIFASLVLHHIKDTEEAFRRLRQIMNSGGHLVAVDLDEDDGGFHAGVADFDGHNGFSHFKLEEMAEKAGFSEVTVKTFYHGSKVFEGREKPYSFFILDAVKK